MAVKRKLKIKKKNFTIFIMCNILLIIGIVLIVHSIINGVNYLSEKKEQKKQEIVNKNENNNNEKKDTSNNKLSDEEIKLKRLGNIDKNIDFFKKEYIDRYISYKNKNTELSNEQIIVNVNMGLDNDFYTNTKQTPYLNTIYVLVNKYYYLPDNYEADDLESINSKYSIGGMKLRKEAKEAFEKLASDALKDNMKIVAMSSYRSYKYQVDLYNKYAKSDGKDAADTYSARPGFSEHQTGLCLDIYDGEIPYTSFEKTNEYNWMQKNAYKYGFILRFPKDKTDETGYKFESWHYRYVGVDAAKYIHDNNISFEEYYVRFVENKK